MNSRFDAAWEIHQFLMDNNFPYAIIGGTALPRWGEPRFTKDVDLVVITSLEEGVAPFVRLLLTHFENNRSQGFASSHPRDHSESLCLTRRTLRYLYTQMASTGRAAR